jgi:acyl-CoA dehydrogenase
LEDIINLAFSEDQEQLRGQVRRFLGDKCPMAAVRTILDGPEPFNRALYREMGDIGLLGATIPEAYGGSGIGPLELCVVAEEAGRVLAPVPLSSSIYLAAEFLMAAGSEAQKSDWLPKLATGEAVGTFAHAERAGRVSEQTILASVNGNRLRGVKAPVPDGDVADVAIVSARGPRGISLWLVDLAGAGVRRERLENIDPTRSQARLIFDDAPAEPLAGKVWSTLSRVLDRAAVLMAFEQIGGADRALEMARDYALERMAFGRPIGSFQAIKHMLCDMYVSTTLARSNCYYGAWAISTEATELSVAAATARVSATQAFLLCTKNNIQVHGGIGFTWEYDCHLYYRRANALALALGSQSTWEDLLIERMRRHEEAPVRSEERA